MNATLCEAVQILLGSLHEGVKGDLIRDAARALATIVGSCGGRARLKGLVYSTAFACRTHKLCGLSLKAPICVDIVLARRGKPNLASDGPHPMELQHSHRLVRLRDIRNSPMLLQGITLQETGSVALRSCLCVDPVLSVFVAILAYE